ncbi:hypothetical protein GEMRC1_010357 [Eukaryota sp. GEM-RC1]
MAEVDAKLKTSQSRLQKCKDKDKELDQKIVDLRSVFSRKTADAEALKQKLARQSDIISKAVSLLSKLSNEQTRWKERVFELRTSIKNLNIESLFAALVLTFLPKCSADVFNSLVESFSQLLAMEAFDLEKFLISERQLLSWQVNGLPNEKRCLLNAVTVLSERKTCLVIDPSGFAVPWLCENLKNSDILIEQSSFNDPRFVATLESAVRFGKTLIVTGVDRFDWLVSIFRKDILQSGSRQLIKIGERTFEFSPNFQMFLFSDDPHLVVPKCIQSLISVISFEISQESLSQQLLSMVINSENADLELQRFSLLKSQESLKNQLTDTEHQLLTQLSSSTGNILENDELIKSLETTKTKSLEVMRGLEKSQKLTSELETERIVFKPLADYGAKIFEICNDLIKISPFYGISVQMFSKIFNNTLLETKSSPTSSAKARIALVSSTFSSKIFEIFSHGLLQKDVLVFSLHLLRGINPDLVKNKDWIFMENVVSDSFSINEDQVSLIKGQLSKDLISSSRRLVYLKQEYPNLYEYLVSDMSALTKWKNKSDADQSKYLEELFTNNLNNSTFAHKLITLATIRPDRLTSFLSRSSSDFFQSQSSAHSVMSSIKNDVGETKTVLLLTTTGTDPTSVIKEAAESCQSKLIEIALGQGQQNSAIKAVNQAISTGSWVLLKNLHLSLNWLTELEHLIESFSGQKVDPNFRLMMTTDLVSGFNQYIIKQSLKICFEPPKSFNNNLCRNFELVSSLSQSDVQSKMMVVSSWLHGVVSSRLSYVPHGWSKKFEFSISDLTACANILIKLLNSRQNSIDSEFLKYAKGLLMTVVYGGRVDSDSDFKILQYLIEQFLTATLCQSQPQICDISLPKSSSTTQIKSFSSHSKAFPLICCS